MALWSRGDDWIANRVYWGGWAGYEPEMAPVFFIFASRSQVIFDVGAHVGFYTLLAAHANPAATVFAFEPHPRVYERLTRNLAMNRLEHVRCFQSACGAADGFAELYSVNVDGIPSASTLDGAVMNPEWGLCSWPVEVLALDRLTSEPQVLQGMREVLRRDRPVIFCEVLPGRHTEEKVEALLRSEGYYYYLLTRRGPQPMASICAHGTWLNWLFAVLEPEQMAALYRSEMAQVDLRKGDRN